ncbi:unnamed protein product [Orchesella dallaii]|uniref:S-formylglutathione hydrolase n=1 Tax=Orchesella dallaii TaxID=48710 RepID=A0ABP1RAB5_9HEXA
MSGPTPTVGLQMLFQRKRDDGVQKIYKHWSKSNNCEMKFSIYIPDSARPSEKFHAIMFLPGAYCNEQDFLNRTNFHEHASEFKFVVVCPDTGPKVEVAGDKDSQWLGQTASWYIDAVTEPWSKHYQMHSYVAKELPELVVKHFPVLPKFGICGHSMGGAGAAVIGLRNTDRFQSISLFAPNCNPISWGADCVFTPLLGAENKDTLWILNDPTEVAKRYDGPFRNILVDQGTEDEYYKRTKTLNPERLVAAAEANPKGAKVIKVNLRMHQGLGHSFDFVEKFWRSHFQHHSQQLELSSLFN